MAGRLANTRHIAVEAIAQYLAHGTFLNASLERLAGQDQPLARQISHGTVQRLLSLEYLAQTISGRKALHLNAQERAILYSALYQAHFLPSLPLYAVVNEAVVLAKKLCRPSFSGFVNALLRTYSKAPPALPEGDSAVNLSLFYSYPLWFVRQLLRQNALQTVREILTAGNEPASLQARRRHSPFDMIELKSPSEKLMAGTSSLYIQGAAQVALIQHLYAHTSAPQNLLDLCAAPGGKLLLAHELYPHSELFANDISLSRLALLKSNLENYGVKAHLSCGPGEQLATERKFDLVILDAPCSNSGVLNKRPEARWRLSPSALKSLQQRQVQLLKHASQLLSEKGSLWYLTCSILKAENENICNQVPLKVIAHKTLLTPEGGFGALLTV